MALGALFLFLANFISVNLAGVAAFLAQGIESRTWWEAKKAKKANVLAIVGWVLLLAILIIIILFFGGFECQNNDISDMKVQYASVPNFKSPHFRVSL